MSIDELIDKLYKIEEIAAVSLNEVAKLAEEIELKKDELDVEDLYNMYITIADAYYYRDHSDEAMDIYTRALKVPAKGKDEARCYCHIAGSFEDKGDYNLAIENCNKVLSMGERNIDKATLGKTYDTLARAFSGMEKYKEAIRYYQKVSNVFAIPKTTFEKEMYEHAICNIATYYWKVGDNRRSEEYFQKVVDLPDITPSILASAYAIKAHRLYEKRKWAEALECYKKAIALTDNRENKMYWQKYADLCVNELKSEEIK